MLNIIIFVLFIAIVTFLFILYHLVRGLKVLLFQKNHKGGWYLLIGSLTLIALYIYTQTQYVHFSSVRNFVTLMWLVGGILCFIGDYIADKESGQIKLAPTLIRIIAFCISLIAHSV